MHDKISVDEVERQRLVVVEGAGCPVVQGDADPKGLWQVLSQDLVYGLLDVVVKKGARSLPEGGRTFDDGFVVDRLHESEIRKEIYVYIYN